MSTPAETAKVLGLERPDPALRTLYLMRAILSAPAILITLPYLYFRYHTLRYRFDEEGIHMRVGILFRREVNITYARIQDIHLRSGLLQRWLGLADVQIQTASGSAGAEMIIEGFKEFESIRDFLYSRMRGAREKQIPATLSTTASASVGTDEIIDLLAGIRDELRATRELLDQRRTGQTVGP
jgi:putative membrane protein